MSIPLGILTLLSMAAVGGAQAAGVAEPAYTVLSTQDDVELRAYAPLIRAETTVNGAYRGSLNDGFRILAKYIFGGNLGSRKLAMTAPVGAESVAPSKIPMTAPVGSEHTDAGWRVSFVMPAGSTLENLPTPLDARVSFHAVPAQRVAALRFSGWAGEAAVARHQAILTEAMEKQGLVATGPPVVAQYNTPWTLPFLRRNEILVAVQDQ